MCASQRLTDIVSSGHLQIRRELRRGRWSDDAGGDSDGLIAAVRRHHAKLPLPWREQRNKAGPMANRSQIVHAHVDDREALEYNVFVCMKILIQ